MISNKGFMEGIITLEASGQPYEGEAVTIVCNNCTGGAALGDGFLGIIRNSRNGIAAVQVKGYAKVKFSETPPIGVNRVGCDGEGGLILGSNGREVIVLSFDEATSIAEIIM